MKEEGDDEEQHNVDVDNNEDEDDDVEIVDVVPPRHLRDHPVIDLSDVEEQHCCSHSNE